MSGQQPRYYRFPRIVALNTASGLVAGFLLASITGRWHGFWELLGVSVTFSNIIGALAHYTFAYVWPPFLKRPAYIRWPAVFVLLTIDTAVGCALATPLFVFLRGGSTVGMREFFFHSFRIGLSISFVIGTVAIIVETLKSRLEETTLELRTRELERERAQKLASEAQLASLESRIHPHFLFNALNSITALIRENPQGAERLVEHLAALLRFSLDSARQRLVPLRQELCIVRDYLEIEKVRFGDRLRFEITAPEELLDVEVPPMSVQTLVENSVKHVISVRREGGSVSVSATQAGARLRIVVSDDGPGFHLESIPDGHGIQNLRARIKTLYGDSASLDVADPASPAQVVLEVPCHSLAVA